MNNVQSEIAETFWLQIRALGYAPDNDKLLRLRVFTLFSVWPK